MNTQKPLILAIDDTPANLLTLGRALEQEYDLQIATSGAMGLSLAAQFPPDLVLLDIMMPEMDGFETCRRLKLIPALKHVPVVFVSALTEIEAETSGLALGAADYITKPVNVKIARQRIANLIAREALRKDVMAQRDRSQAQVIELEQARQALLQTQKALEEEKAFTHTILNSLIAHIAVLDGDGVIQMVNEPWQRFGIDNAKSPDDGANQASVGTNYLDVCQKAMGYHDNDAQSATEALQGIKSVLDGSLPRFSMEYPCHSLTQQRWFHMVVTPLPLSTRNGVVIAHTDITQRIQAQAQLADSEAHLRAIILNEPECIKVVDPEGRLMQMNPAGLTMIEAESVEQVKGRPVLDLIAPECRSAFADMHARVIAGETMQLEFEVLGLKGGRRWLETHAVPLQDHGQTVHLAVTRDVTARRQMEEQVRHLAFYDGLTNLPNRRLLLDRLNLAMSANKRSGRYTALMFIDLDNFKPLNDAHGHQLGDLLLIEVAKRIKACVREIDTVARFGGDEFVVMLTDLSTEQDESASLALTVAEKIRTAVAEPYHFTVPCGALTNTRVDHRCTASMGVVLFLNHNGSDDDLLNWADAAMYQAKEAGRNCIQFHQATPTTPATPAVTPTAPKPSPAA